MDVQRRLEAQSRSAVVLRVSARVYRAMWGGIAIVHVLSTVYLGLFAMFYLFLARPTMTYYATLLSPDAPQQLTPMGVALVFLAIAHTVDASRMMFYSVLYRELVYGVKSQRVEATEVSTDHQPQRRERRCFSNLLASCWQRMWTFCCSTKGFFGVKSVYFDLRYTLREAIEIVAQTLQLYTSTQLIAKTWITSVYAAVVVMNCWSTPIVQYCCRRQIQNRVASLQLDVATLGRTSKEGNLQGSIALERLLCISIDFILDVIVSVGLPVIIVVPYVLDFDISVLDFPNEKLYDEVWFVNMVYENQQVLATSWFEVLYTLFPHWSIYVCCNSIRSLIRQESSTSHGGVGPVSSSLMAKRRSNPTIPATRGPRRSISFATAVVPTFQNLERLSKLRRALTSNAAHVLFFTWGLVILGLHLGANNTRLTLLNPPPPGCQQILHPWLTEASACSVFEFNCYANGSQSVTEDILRSIHQPSLAVLILSHCDELSVPQALAEYPNLLGLTVYNSTIVNWDHRAISEFNHKRLAYLQLVRTNMSRFPEGLMVPLPPQLLDIEIVASNLTSLPPDLDSYWHSLSVLYLELCEFTEIPEALTRLQVDELSLIGNKITTLQVNQGDLTSSSASDVVVTFSSLWLNHNPLSSLPTTIVGDFSKIQLLALEHTTIGHLPEWVIKASRAGATLYLSGSTFCATHIDEDMHISDEDAIGRHCLTLSPCSAGLNALDVIDRGLPLIREMK